MIYEFLRDINMTHGFRGTELTAREDKYKGDIPKFWIE